MVGSRYSQPVKTSKEHLDYFWGQVSGANLSEQFLWDPLSVSTSSRPDTEFTSAQLLVPVYF